MGNMGEFWKDGKEDYKLRCEKRNYKFEPQLKQLGAVLKSDGVYEFDGWFCYPTKGFAMKENNPQQRMSLGRFIKDRI